MQFLSTSQPCSNLQSPFACIVRHRKHSRWSFASMTRLPIENLRNCRHWSNGWKAEHKWNLLLDLIFVYVTAKVVSFLSFASRFTLTSRMFLFFNELLNADWRMASSSIDIRFSIEGLLWQRFLVLNTNHLSTKNLGNFFKQSKKDDLIVVWRYHVV